MKAKAGEQAVQAAAKVAACVEESFAANPLAAPMLDSFRKHPEENEASMLKVMRAMLGQDHAFAGSLADILTAEPAQAEAALQSMVNVSQNIRTVKGDVVGAIVGDDVLRSIGVIQDVDTVESGGVVVGAVIGNSGSSMTIGGQHNYGDTYQAGSSHSEQTIHAQGGGVAAGGDISGSTIVTGDDNAITQSSVDTGGGAYAGGNVSISGGDFVGRDNIRHGDRITTDISGSSDVAAGKDIHQRTTTTTGFSGDEIARLFEPLLAVVAELPQAEQAQAQALADDIISETAKGEEASDGKIARTFKSLGALAPAAAAILGSPVLTGIVGPVTKFVIEEWRR